MDTIFSSQSPLNGIDVSFAHYVQRRRDSQTLHLDGGIPDYAFSLDYELRKKLDEIPHFRNLCAKIGATLTTREIQRYNQIATAVGPKQYPEIYRMGMECAERLGIGAPNIFIVSDMEMNAFTYAMDDVSPMIVLHSGIIDRMTPGELKCVIAHECGHIHNRHMLYKNVISQLLNGASGNLGMIVSVANLALMQLWTRACEITADRASMICSNDLRDAVSVQSKLLSGGIINPEFQDEANIDALREQMELTMGNPTRLYEALYNHPSSVRRIFCIKEFEECEIFYRWRNDLRTPGVKERSKADTDARCQKLVNIWNNR